MSNTNGQDQCGVGKSLTLIWAIIISFSCTDKTSRSNTEREDLADSAIHMSLHFNPSLIPLGSMAQS